MTTQISTVLLVDDDEMDNLAHQRLITNSELVDEVVVFQNAFQALDFLKQSNTSVDLLLLDVNMPQMHCTEFLERHNELPATQHVRATALLSGTPLFPNTVAKIEQLSRIVSWNIKPLTLDSLTATLARLEN